MRQHTNVIEAIMVKHSKLDLINDTYHSFIVGTHLPASISSMKLHGAILIVSSVGI